MKKSTTFWTESELWAAIKEAHDRQKPCFGQLVRYRTGWAGLAWHYGIQLKKRRMLSWGDYGNDSGEFMIHKIPLHTWTVRSESLSLDHMMANMRAAIRAFHGDWDYNLLGWNCEHVARLIVTGQAVSHQAFCDYRHYMGELAISKYLAPAYQIW